VEEQKIKSPGSPKTLKTYNSRDSLMVTHLTTNPSVSCLNRVERTGSLVVSATPNPISLKLTVYRRQRPVNSPMQKTGYCLQ
jgi:hypothetical protein